MGDHLEMLPQRFLPVVLFLKLLEVLEGLSREGVFHLVLSARLYRQVMAVHKSQPFCSPPLWLLSASALILPTDRAPW